MFHRLPLSPFSSRIVRRFFSHCLLLNGTGPRTTASSAAGRAPAVRTARRRGNTGTIEGKNTRNRSRARSLPQTVAARCVIMVYPPRSTGFKREEQGHAQRSRMSARSATRTAGGGAVLKKKQRVRRVGGNEGARILSAISDIYSTAHLPP